jgi:alkanesulfonate monooxygenase SsuD/methylene tetrahydromethanopterin reductase-like flavin-dependent oxidoreductase (luciferase family)
MRTDLQIGLAIEGTTGVAEEARAAERAGFDFLGCGEHVFFHGPMSNAFVTLAAAAGATSRIRLMSTLTLLPLYPAVLAAKLAASLDVVSGGRFELGVGVGGEFPPEFEAVGVPVGERGRRTDAALAVLGRLLTGGTTDNGLALDPPPVQRPRPPILVGGRKAAAQRRAGRYADAWMPYLVTPEQLARGLVSATEVAAAHDRPPVGGAVFLWTAVDDDGGRARRTAVEAVGATYAQDFSRYADSYLVSGDPPAVAARIREYAEAGAARILIAPARTPDAAARNRMATLLAAEVLPALRD